MAKVERVCGKKGISDVYLIVDSRERNVIPFVETEFQEYAYVVKQVTTADYLVCRKGPGGAEPTVLAAIERKTHTDFAASFKDGRHENIKKMRALREKTGCQLYFFIEGPAFPSPDRRFARIPFSSILSAITNLMVRDGVFIVQTENEWHSAKRLSGLVRAFDTCALVPAPALVPAATDAAGLESAAAVNPGAAPDRLVVPAVLTERTDQTDSEAVVCMWARLRGVSVVLGKILAQEFTLAELVGQKVSIARLEALRTATGRIINKDALASLTAVREGSHDHGVKLVSGLRNVSPATAVIILDKAGGLRSLCDQPSAFLALTQLPQKGRTVRLGKVRAERIWRTLHYKEGAVPTEHPGYTLREGPRAEGPCAEEPTVEWLCLVDELLAAAELV